MYPGKSNHIIPARRCYSLFHWAGEQGKQVELASSFLKAAFVQGVNTDKDQGMAHVVEQAGLSWHAAQKVIDNNDWQEELESNRTTMYGFDCWGVPSCWMLRVSLLLPFGGRIGYGWLAARFRLVEL